MTLQKRQTKLGPYHPDTLATLNSLAIAHDAEAINVALIDVGQALLAPVVKFLVDGEGQVAA